MDLPSLHVVILSKLPSVYLQNVLSTFIVFHTALHLIKEHKVCQEDHDCEIHGFTTFPKLLAW